MKTQNIELPKILGPSLKSDLTSWIPLSILSKLKQFIRFLSMGLGSVFYIPSVSGGLLLWLVFAQELRYGLFVAAGLIISFGVISLLRLADSARSFANISANALLASIAVSWLTAKVDLSYQIEAGLLIFVVVMVTFVAAAMIRTLSNTNLPPFALGYSLVVGILFTLFPEWTSIAASSIPEFSENANWGLLFLRSLGTLLYMPVPQVGVIVGLAIFLWSRTMFLTGAVGWLAGISTALALHGLGVDYPFILSAHNYFIAGMLVGSVIFLPGRLSFVCAIIAGASASVFAAAFQNLFSGSGFAFLPLPSIATIWLAIGALAFAIEKRIVTRNDNFTIPPEESWWQRDYWARRAGYPDPYIGVPVEGRVEIIQGFDGKYSHKGLWSHALDFQRPASEISNTDIVKSTWGTPVYAPMAGIVEVSSDRTIDNQPGVSNYGENWGNYIIMRLDQGGWLLLGHFRQGSIVVHPGTCVTEGDYLGEIGNSGRSPYPHLHVQVQSSREPGAPTIPFRLANYLTHSKADPDVPYWNASGLPEEGTLLEVARRNQDVLSILTSISPGSAVWRFDINGKIPAKYRPSGDLAILKIDISLDEAGRHVFTDASGNYIVVSIDYDAWRIIECKPGKSPFLRLLAFAATSIPHAAQSSMIWDEPVLLSPDGLMSWWELAMAPYGRSGIDYAHSKCIAVPDLQSRALTIETVIESEKSQHPAKITSTYEFLRGPIELKAEFGEGDISLTLQSFEPHFSIHSYEESGR